MTPDQLPAGLRVKALEWSNYSTLDGQYSVQEGTDGFWLAWCVDEFSSAAFNSKEEAKAACQRRRDELVCAQLEIVNG